MYSIITKHKTVTHRSYKKFNEAAFLDDIRHCDVLSCNVLPHPLLTEQWRLWKEAFLSICNKHAPLKQSRVRDKLSPWMTPDVIEMIYKRDYLKRVAVRSKSLSDLVEYRKLRNYITVFIRKKKQCYFDDVSKKHINNPKALWNELHKVTGISKSYDGLPNDITADDMNDYFVNVSSSIANSFDRKAPVWRNPQSVYTFSFSNISVDNVCRHLNNLSEDSKLDVLSFDSKLLRLSAPCISASLSQMYNTSLKTGIVPNDWLFSRVTPVYKGKGDKCEKKNYRPIAVVCHIAKLIEKEVNSQFLSYLLEHDFITIDQHAFLSNHSTSTCIHQVTDDWFETLTSLLPMA